MRKIKFRAWSKEDKMMFQWPDLGNVPLLNFDMETFIWLQFTNLLDKNGKEIYAGDILKGFSKNNGKTTITQVSYFDKEFGCYPDNELNIMWKEWEVIGNIYENPELLNN